MGVVRSLDTLAGVLGCNVGRLPMICLGMPLGAHFRIHQFGILL